ATAVAVVPGPEPTTTARPPRRDRQNAWAQDNAPAADHLEPTHRADLMSPPRTGHERATAVVTGALVPLAGALPLSRTAAAAAHLRAALPADDRRQPRRSWPHRRRHDHRSRRAAAGARGGGARRDRAARAARRRPLPRLAARTRARAHRGGAERTSLPAGALPPVRGGAGGA